MEEVNKVFGQKLNSSLFTWDNYCGQLGFSVLKVFSDTKNNIVNSDYILEGWCYANALQIRPREEGIAIMLLDIESDEHFWCHVNKDYMETLERLYDLRNNIKTN
jgi:hypothetical protein